MQKPVHSAQAIVIRGCFPLKDSVDAKLPEPPEIELTTLAETPDDESDSEQPGDLEVDNVVQHPCDTP